MKFPILLKYFDVSGLTFLNSYLSHYMRYDETEKEVMLRERERERERRNRHTKHLIESHCEFMMVILIQFRVIKYVYLCEHHIWDSFAPNTFLASSNFNTCRYNFYILLHTKLCQLHLKYLNFIDMNNLSTNNPQ